MYCTLYSKGKYQGIFLVEAVITCVINRYMYTSAVLHALTCLPYVHVCAHLYFWPSPSKPSFYRQITSYQRGMGDHRAFDHASHAPLVTITYACSVNFMTSISKHSVYVPCRVP